MPAFVIYDYTPFIMLLLTWSLVALSYCQREKSGVLVKNQAKEVFWSLMAAVSIISMATTKQNYAAYAGIYSLIYIMKSNRIAKFAFLGFMATSISIYLQWQISSTGIIGLFNIYTDASYKGGGGSIVSRVLLSVLESLKAPDYSATLNAFAIGILLAYLLTCYASRTNLVANFASLAAIKHSKHVSSVMSIATFAMAIALLALLSGVTQSIVPVIRGAGVALIVIFVIVAAFVDKGIDGPTSKQAQLLAVPMLSVVMLNAMSGSTGGLDSFIPFSLSICLVLKELELVLAAKAKGQGNPLKIKSLLALMSMLYLWAVPVGALRDILGKGYTWWGVSERPSTSSISFFLQKIRNQKPQELSYSGRDLMNESQRAYADRLVRLVQRYKLRNPLKPFSILAFPNIPIIYTISQSRSYANAPVPWIDVLPMRVSSRIISKWNQEKPDIIVYNLLPMAAYAQQQKAFAGQDSGDRAMLKLNRDILRLAFDGYYVIIDGYSNDQYGIFTLVSRDVFDFSAIGFDGTNDQRLMPGLPGLNLLTRRQQYLLSQLTEQRKGGTDLISLSAINQMHSVNIAPRSEGCQYEKVFTKQVNQLWARDRTTVNSNRLLAEKNTAASSPNSSLIAIAAQNDFSSLLKNGYASSIPVDCP
ncbi:hypothetical protein KBY72_12095 [Cyanobium sp. BA5m-21]|uniref:hypothetical protein n=1 Tax=Cyanobium sp. BA5m-21 TaxID=2823706 RepID=UPI0020CD3288|nr:hypothetical protein [Cyanobium sp. BA5m-21]MCP9907907.1 hypothetical protein [Cyanobium sp. BA5m-21]